MNRRRTSKLKKSAPRFRSMPCFFITLKPLVLSCLSFLFVLQMKAQQEQMYSQYMFNMLHVNPAYAGNRAADNITLLYRKQWMNIPGSPQTATLSWDRRQSESNVGYGLELYNDQLGVEKTTGVQAFYSYHIPLDNSFLALGVCAGVLNYSASFSEVDALKSGDAMFQSDVSGLKPTAGFGTLYATDRWYAGFSVPALFSTKIKVENSGYVQTVGGDNHYFLVGGYLFTLSDAVKLKPSFLMKAVKGSSMQEDFNLNTWIYDTMCFGVSYRTQDAVVVMFELQLIDELRLGYAYDYTISSLNEYSKGTHEIMLRYEFNNVVQKGRRVLSPRYY
ncbi:MAG: type IX secretion system membrane protein PorP/SprF [Paludibacteraceae bacterium]|nr:type IX secretion system membrane protein PorP/SprF [Paludibacteraceae bacterium]